MSRLTSVHSFCPPADAHPLQVCKHLQAVGTVCSVRVMAVVGGLAQVKQERLLAKRPEVGE